MDPPGTLPPPPPAADPAAAASLVATRIWDLPTRLFHWTLAAAVVGSVVSAKIGGNAMVWHFRFGTLVLALLAFRLLWGLVGGRWSRFASFLHAPGTVLRYLRGRARPGEHLDVGHSPVGALSVYALLLVLALQVATGLVADDEIANIGPLNRFVAVDTGLAATALHQAINAWVLIGLAALHVTAVVYYRVARGTDLVGPMLHGDKRLPAGTPASADGARQRLRAVLLALACAALAGWVMSLGRV